MGRSKNARKRPSALTRLLKKCSSSMVPSTTPRMVGATGKPQRSMKNATTPATSITVTPNRLLLIAKLPTTQNSRISGISTAAGICRMRLATLIAIHPSGSIRSCASMKTMNTA
jgi:hypothetical protein